MLPAVHIVLPSVHTSLATTLCWHHGWQCRPENVIGSYHGAQCMVNVGMLYRCWDISREWHHFVNLHIEQVQDEIL